MRVVESRKLEDCFDGSSVRLYRFDGPWTPAGIVGLKPLGKVEYFADLPRPFFRLRTPRGMFVQGICGEDTCRVILPGEGNYDVRRDWEALFSSPGPDDKTSE